MADKGGLGCDRDRRQHPEGDLDIEADVTMLVAPIGPSNPYMECAKVPVAWK